jgi:hypothetical protein
MSIYGLIEGIGANAISKDSYNIIWKFKRKIVY